MLKKDLMDTTLDPSEQYSMSAERNISYRIKGNLSDVGNIKGANVFPSDFLGLPCLLQLYTRLHLSNYGKL